MYDAWHRIEVEIGKPIKELKAKKDSLMATYGGYCRKVAASMKSGPSGDVYKPIWFAFELMDQFLGSIYNCGGTTNTEEVHSISEAVGETDQPIDNGNDVVEMQQDKVRKSTGKTIRRRADPPELQDAAKQMKTAFDTLHSVINKKGESEDKCAVFGKLVAEKLKKLSEDDKEDIMFEIQQIFHNRNVQRPYSVNSSSSSLTSPFSVHSMMYEPAHSFQQCTNLQYENAQNSLRNVINEAFQNS
nr:uncharacterized protein LOC111422150 [Onthophagus taurus]